MSIVFTDNQNYQDIADAIRAKNGSSDTYLPSEMADAIMDISGGGSSNPEDADVIFFDYDGSIMYTFTAEEALALEAMPFFNDAGLWDSDGLHGRGWNYSLAQLKDTVRACGKCYVGTMYVPNDWTSTYIIVEFKDGRHSPYLGIAPKGTIIIDWGDGSDEQTITGTSTTSVKYTFHEFPADGKYRIKIRTSSGTGFGMVGTSSLTKILTVSSTSNSTNDWIYSSTVKAVNEGFSSIYSTSASYSGALNGCKNLESVSFHEYWGGIPSNFMSNCYSLYSLALPLKSEGTMTIGTTSFQNCYSLKWLSISPCVTSIGTSAFSKCRSLRNIIIPSSVTSIGTSAFEYCTSLQNAFIASSSIGTYAFRYCYSLQNVTLTSSVTSINDSAFSYCYLLKNITIPSSITTINPSTFESCYALQNITIPSSVTSIGNNAFSNCYSLQNITIPSLVTKLNGSTFSSCSQLQNITIPSLVTEIGTNCFASCYSLHEIHLKPTNPPTIGSTSFGIKADCIIYVPYSADHSILTAYQEATNWSTYASYMREEEPSA